MIAGKHRGKKLAAFGGQSVRPTPDRVKESLFQILEPRLAGARVLDLFAGSGALGIEALSRGAREAVFNDISAESLQTLRKNLALTGERGTVYNLGYEACLLRVSGEFDLIFCDPPYAERFTEAILRTVKERGLLASGGLVVYESEREEVAPAGWRLADARSYGRTKIYFFSGDGV